MPKIIKIATGCLALTLLLTAKAWAAPEPVQTIPILLWIIGGLITFINTWVTITQVKLWSKVGEVDTRLVKLETKHMMHHPEEHV